MTSTTAHNDYFSASKHGVRNRVVATGGISVYIVIYPPKIRPGKFLWSKNDVLMVIDFILHY